MQECDVCSGEGFIWEDVDGKQWDGIGSTDDYIRTPCPVCDGNGWIEIN